MPEELSPVAQLGGTPLLPEELAAIPDFAPIDLRIWSQDRNRGAVARQTFEPGEIICREGESGSTAFFVESGTVEVLISSPLSSHPVKKPPTKGLHHRLTQISDYLRGIPSRDQDEERDRQQHRTHIHIDASTDLPLANPIAELGPGEIFGELCALAVFRKKEVLASGREGTKARAKFYPRSATVRAKSRAVVLEMLPQVLNNVLYKNAAFKKKLDENYRTRALDSHLRSVPLFRNISPEFMEYLKKNVELVDADPDQIICRQGDVADAFYLIRLGFVKVSQSFPGGDMVMNYLTRGSYFGEIGLLPTPLRLRARGRNPGEVAEGVVGAESLLCGRAPSGERSMKVDWDDYLSRQHFSAQLESQKVRVKRLKQGKNPLKFNNQPQDSFLASPGETFTVGGTTFEVFQNPDEGGRRTTTCTAMDVVQLVRIKAEDFSRMLAEFPDVAAAIGEVARGRQQMNAEMLNRLETVSLNDFLEQDLMQAQNLLLIDLDRCTRCDECAKACATTHEGNISRLFREGLRFDKYLVPTSCRACMDPVCMVFCPVGAIRRKSGLNIVIEPWCIGCNACAEECPYGNITIVDLANRPGNVRKAMVGTPKAVVCDLCAEYEEPNCVRACPHDAAIRVEPKLFFAKQLRGVQLIATETVSLLQNKSQPKAAPAEAGFQAKATREMSGVADLSMFLPRFRIRSGTRAGEILQFKYPLTKFGRNPENDYRFPEDTELSRFQCTIRVEKEHFYVADTHSTNGTYLNGNPLGETETELRPGDVVQMGETELEFLFGPQS